MALARIAIAGLGGFARNHHEAVLALEATGKAKLVATCDPDEATRESVASDLRFGQRGVRVYVTLDALLGAEAGNLDLVCLPTPIPLHAPMHRACVDAGVAVYLEKPPTLWLPELDEMIATDLRASKATRVGFNFVGDPFRRKLKRRTLSGEFGALHEVVFWGHWPRGRVYYDRAPWAGRIRLADRWVLDNPIGNAMAHYIQNLLFWAGRSEQTVGDVGAVRAVLQRGHAIQSFDTVFLEAEVGDGVALRVAASHFVQGHHSERETVRLEHACIHLDWRSAEIRWKDGRIEKLESEFRSQNQLLAWNLERYWAYLQGLEERPVTTLTDSRPFVSLIDLAFLSAQRIEPVQDPQAVAGALDGFTQGSGWPDEKVPAKADASALSDPATLHRELAGF